MHKIWRTLFLGCVNLYHKLAAKICYFFLIETRSAFARRQKITRLSIPQKYSKIFVFLQARTLYAPVSRYSTVFNCRSGTIIFFGKKFQVLRPYLMVVRLTKIAVVVLHENSMVRRFLKIRF